MNVKIGTEAAQFPEKKYPNGIFVAVHFLPPHFHRRRTADCSQAPSASIGNILRRLAVARGLQIDVVYFC